MRFCVYTVLLDRYEPLNEQPMAARSGIPFICLTDNHGLTSASWQIRHAQPLFPLDPIRSQREIKLRPHAYLPEFDASLYIDNSVILSEPPELLFERHFPASGLLMLEHSFRSTILLEFLEVVRVGLDDPSRIFEQLNHYMAQCPEVLLDKPLWSGIMLRDHRNPKLRAMLEVWLSHVLRYSRRDQLSSRVALRQTGFAPDVLRLDNNCSWFHTWPHTAKRDHDKGKYHPSALLAPSLREPGQERLPFASARWRAAAALIRCAGRCPGLTRFVLRVWHYLRRVVCSGPRRES